MLDADLPHFIITEPYFFTVLAYVKVSGLEYMHSAAIVQVNIELDRRVSLKQSAVDANCHF